jgi:hypothetical protein
MSMAFPGRIAARLLIVMAIALSAGPEAGAASRSWGGCGRGDSAEKGCASRRASSTKSVGAHLAARARSRIWGWPKLYRGDEGAISQLSPRLRPRGVSRLRFDRAPHAGCGRGQSRRRCAQERDLAEALVQPPNPATEKLLREHGIPAIPGVPPIVILKSAVDNWGFVASP